MKSDYYYEMIPNINLDQTLTYKSPVPLVIGQLVVIKIRTQEVVGLVCFEHQELNVRYTVKDVLYALPYTYPPSYISFLQQASQYTLIKIGHLFKMSLISLESCKKQEKEDIKRTYSFFKQDLNAEQQVAYQTIEPFFNHFQTFLLDGVTGSGKTEVYFSLAKKALENNKKTLILLPEIALTQAIVKRFTYAFGTEPIVWHSGITSAKKRKYWKSVTQKGPDVILGARSALFLPYADLDLIIIDEEHDSSYKQDEQGIYNARDLAILRAKHEKIPIILGSATPSLETFVQAQNQKYIPITLHKRFENAQLPSMHVIDRKQYGQHFITPPLLEGIEKRLEKKEQSLLFLNRRGFATLLICSGCGYKFECPSCQVDLVFHKKQQQALCHYCAFTIPEPKDCPVCQNSDIKNFGIGIEKVEEELKHRFPKATVISLSSDLLMNPKKAAELFHQIESRQADLIVGTQVLAKGHHFPHLTLVGILDADSNNFATDLRSNEKTFHILSQVSGRAGRLASRKGVVYIQTFLPESPLLQALKTYDRDAFYALELSHRELAYMPPFSRLISVIVSSLREDHLLSACRTLSKAIPYHEDVEILGPTPAPLYKLKSRYRMRFLIRGPKNKNLQAFIKPWLNILSKQKNVTLHVDVDPQTFF